MNELQEDSYTAAFTFYESGDYVRSRDLFLQLVFVEPWDERYWSGLASTYQMLHEYKEAVHAWGVAALLNDKDPYAHFHAAECLHGLGDNTEMEKALECTERRMATSHHALRRQIQTLRDTL